MGNVYSAQNVAAYFIYELNHTFLNSMLLQQLLAKIDVHWKKEFGHSAFTEKTYSLDVDGYFVKEVYDEYKEHGQNHITTPAKEWYLEYGKFQLVQRTVGIPVFTSAEEQVIKSVIANYRRVLLKVS